VKCASIGLVSHEVVAASDGSLTVTVPIRIRRRGLRKIIVLPDGDSLHRRRYRHRSNWRWPVGIGGSRCWSRVR
jgi:hypothetical protein